MLGRKASDAAFPRRAFYPRVTPRLHLQEHCGGGPQAQLDSDGFAKLPELFQVALGSSTDFLRLTAIASATP